MIGRRRRSPDPRERGLGSGGVPAGATEPNRATAASTKPAGRTSYGGYAGYFTDPDGHAWEIARNPGFALDEHGNLSLPDFGIA